MRGAVEAGPSWIRHKGYFFKQLVNCNVFVAQLGFCCVYFVFMADNLEDFFRKNVGLVLPKAIWMILICIPVLGICSIRKLSKLAPFATAANVIYLGAVAIVVYFFFNNLKSTSELTKWGEMRNLPLFFGTVMFAFEGVSVVSRLDFDWFVFIKRSTKLVAYFTFLRQCLIFYFFGVCALSGRLRRLVVFY